MRAKDDEVTGELARMAGPVRDHEGHTVWFVRVAPGELTCTGCGETMRRGKHCVRCGQDEEGKPLRTRHDARPPVVETLSYLREGEYTLDH